MQLDDVQYVFLSLLLVCALFLNEAVLGVLMGMFPHGFNILSQLIASDIVAYCGNACVPVVWIHQRNHDYFLSAFITPL